MKLKQLRRLTPNKIRRLTDRELQELTEAIQTMAVDYSIVIDLIRDRNDFRVCYSKLREQIRLLGVEPCVDYYSLYKRGKTNV